VATILVVDDEPANRNLLAKLLRMRGHHTLQACDGAEALDRVRAERPDLVITDILMPTMDGYAFVRHLRAEPAIAATRVVFWTGRYEEDEVDSLAKITGVTHLLPKPLDHLSLFQTVDDALAAPAPAPTAEAEQFDREHLRLLTDKLARHVAALEEEVATRKRREQELQASQERLALVSRELMRAQENERRRLARELHDEIGQVLTAVKLNLHGLQNAGTAADATARVTESLAIVDRAIQQVRDLSLDLRPSLLDDLGLLPALRWYVDRHALRAGLTARVVATPPDLRSSSDVETTCFRVVQEAVTNVLRHAKASELVVELRREAGAVQLTVRDNGVGFDVPARRRHALGGGSLGLLSMQERVTLLGGGFNITSRPGGGTVVCAEIPEEPPAP
jgi:signal transduction histidine kinase